MKDRELKLNRLFQAARSAPAPGVADEMPAHLKARVLAHWRSDETRESGWLSLASLFRQALACAALAMLVCLVWSQGAPGVADVTSELPSEEMLASYELPAELLP